MRLRRTIALALLPAVLLGLAACGDDGDGEAAANPATTVAAGGGSEVAAATIVIDVRTPAEYAEGHLEGAVNLSLETGALEAALAGMDPAASYQVYCRTGRRSALATDLMRSKGFTRIEDLGGLDEAAGATGLPVVAG